QRALAALAGDDRGDALILEPAEQPPELGPQNALIRQPREERLDRVEHDTARADRIDRVAQADEQALEIVVAGLLDLVALDAHVIEDDPLLADEPGEIEAEGRDVLSQFVGALLEAHEHARLIELRRAMDQEAEGKQCLAAAGSAADERGPPRRESASRDLVETFNPGGSFRQL